MDNKKSFKKPNARQMVVYIILAYIVISSILEVALKKVDFSETENRKLSQFPEFSVEALIEGDFTDGLTNYLCDHFPFRNTYMKLFAAVQRVEGKKEINGVYLCDDKYYIEKNNQYENLEKFTNKVKALSDKYGDISVSLMLVPTAVTVEKDKLPAFASSGYQLEAIDYIKDNVGSDVKFIDVTKTLEEHKNDTQLYYRTDHHWTTDAAYLAYENYCDALGLKKPSKNDYTIKKVSSVFYGTISSKVNDNNMKPDDIYCYDKKRNLSVLYQNGESDSLYNEDYLSKKDKYSYFLNNINDIIVITNKDVKNGKNLLVFKDSYANCFIPFVTDNYENVIVLDTRYYMYGCEKLVENYNISDILVLYNMNTLDTDTGINGIY